MTLEARYRRLCRLFPPEWREQNEEALVATLLDGAEPGRGSVPCGEAADLARAAIVLRYRALRCRPGAAGIAPPAHPARAAGLALVLAAGVALALQSWMSGIPVEFLLTSLVVVMVPGTGVVYTVSSAIGGGGRCGLFAAIGCTLGIVPHLLAAMLGLSGVVQAGALAFEAVRWAGVAYLAFMGVSMIVGGSALRLDQRRASRDSMGQVVRRGILLNLLNPKLTVFFFAFLPQFLDTPPGLADRRLVELGGVFMLMTLAIFAAYAGASASVRDRVLGAPAVLRWVQRSLGALVIGFATKLAVTNR
jgi:threonine/homoserine/homoserine lactone efflux protein